MQEMISFKVSQYIMFASLSTRVDITCNKDYTLHRIKSQVWFRDVEDGFTYSEFKE